MFFEYRSKEVLLLSTATKKQCASRPATHTLYYIENEFLIKISALRQFRNSLATIPKQFHDSAAKKIRKATFGGYLAFFFPAQVRVPVRVAAAFYSTVAMAQANRYRRENRRFPHHNQKLQP